MKTALKSKDAKIKATLVFNDVFFDLKMPKCQKCQRCQNGKNAKMQKICQNAKSPKNVSPFKKFQQFKDAKTREINVTSEISHDAAFRN